MDLFSNRNHLGENEIKSSKQLIIQPGKGWLNLKLDAVWRYRELLYFLIWRDIKVRYKQTALGVTWVLLQPLVSTLVFSGLFGVLLQVPSGDIPYPLFVLSGLIVWQYFSGSLNRTANSVVDNSSLVTKIYFPRLIIPIAAALSGLVDFFITGGILFALFIVYKIPLLPSIGLLPIFLLLTIVIALGFGLWFSALNVRYRDIKHLMPFLIQIWMYLTPVIYSAALIPEPFRWLLSLNPVTAAVVGFRWALFGNQVQEISISTPLLIISIVIAFVVFFSGLVYFRKTERFFADII
jgi:lipopolysaccharide transport system permease protein